MIDWEIIQGQIDQDNQISDLFFYVKCRPLLTSIMRLVFSSPVEYNEKMDSELYDFLCFSISLGENLCLYIFVVFFLCFKWIRKYAKQLMKFTLKLDSYDYPTRE